MEQGNVKPARWPWRLKPSWDEHVPECAVRHLETPGKGIAVHQHSHTPPRDHVALVTSRSGIAGHSGTSPVLLHRRTLAEVLLRRAPKGHAGRWYELTAPDMIACLRTIAYM